MLPRELRKVQWLKWLAGDPRLCKALRAFFVDKHYINALHVFNLI